MIRQARPLEELRRDDRRQLLADTAVFLSLIAVALAWFIRG